MEAYHDNRQTELTDAGCKSRLGLNRVKGVDYTEGVYCPFCLYKSALIDFRVKKVDGWSNSMANCPDCNNNMRMESLTRNMTIVEYAKWVFDYSLNGFWNKCPFEKFTGRLKAYGWSYQFWEKYKEFKGDEPEYH